MVPPTSNRFIKEVQIPYDSEIINKEVELWAKQPSLVPGSLKDGNLESPVAYQLDEDSDHPFCTIK